MSEGKKRALVIILDMILLAVVVVSAYKMIKGGSSAFNHLFTCIIVVSIPTIFVMTFTTFAGSRFDVELPEEDDEEEEIPRT